MYLITKFILFPLLTVCNTVYFLSDYSQWQNKTQSAHLKYINSKIQLIAKKLFNSSLSIQIYNKK